MKCKFCGKKFIPHPQANGVQKFCSRKCCKFSYRAVFKSRRCQLCGHWFKPKMNKSKFCSKRCSRRFQHKEFWITRKLKCVIYKGGRCKVCGYNKCIAALDFHHRNPKLKQNKNLTNRSFSLKRNWKDLKQELDKCDLLCSNCHREIHSNDIERWKR